MTFLPKSTLCLFEKGALHILCPNRPSRALRTACRKWGQKKGWEVRSREMLEGFSDAFKQKCFTLVDAELSPRKASVPPKNMGMGYKETLSGLFQSSNALKS